MKHVFAPKAMVVPSAPGPGLLCPAGQGAVRWENRGGEHGPGWRLLSPMSGLSHFGNRWCSPGRLAAPMPALLPRAPVFLPG